MVAENLAAKQTTESDAELLAEPAVDDEIDRRLECQQQHRQQLEHHQCRGRFAEATNTDHCRVHHVRRLLTYATHIVVPCNFYFALRITSYRAY